MSTASRKMQLTSVQETETAQSGASRLGELYRYSPVWTTAGMFCSQARVLMIVKASQLRMESLAKEARNRSLLSSLCIQEIRASPQTTYKRPKYWSYPMNSRELYMSSILNLKINVSPSLTIPQNEGNLNLFSRRWRKRKDNWNLLKWI